MGDNDDTLKLHAEVKAKKHITGDDLLSNGDGNIVIPKGTLGRINKIKYVSGGALLVVQFIGYGHFVVEPAWVTNL